MMNFAALGAATVIAAVVLFADTASMSGSSAATLSTSFKLPPEPPPLLLRNVSPDDAISINERIPFSREDNFPAQPFRVRGDGEARGRALECLTMAVYYEAGSQDQAGQEAVAQVVLNRVSHPAFPNSICGVVFQGFERKTGCQFTFTCDGSLLREPDRKAWATARQVAEQALSGAVFQPVGLATFYHADYVVPYWATSLEKNAQVGAHIFYRWPRAWGMPAAFLRKYTGNEADPASLMTAAVMGHGRWLALANPDADKLEIAPDPRVELLAVVRLLAAEGLTPHDGDGRYEKDIKAYFQPEADYPAVQMFKKLSEGNADFTASATNLLLNLSPPPDLVQAKDTPEALVSALGSDKDVAAFLDALRGFARHSEFQHFFVGHKPYYGTLVRGGQTAGIASAQWRAYTGLDGANGKLVISSLLGRSSTADCGAYRPGTPAVRSMAVLAGTSKAEAFLGSRTDPNLFRAAASPSSNQAVPIDPAVQDQIVRAVFVRIAALTSDDAAGREALKREVQLGYKLVPIFETRLRDFEAHRLEFRTLADFLPRLLAGIPAAELERASASQCAPPAVASAGTVPIVQSGAP